MSHLMSAQLGWARVRDESGTPRPATQPVQFRLGEKIDVCILLRKEGKTQVNERIVLTCIMAPPSRFRDEHYNVGNIPTRHNVG